MSVNGEVDADATDECALFELRREADSFLQPTYQASLRALLEATHGRPTPYRLGYDDKIRAIEACAIKTQPRWEAQIPGGKYLYRIGAWESLIKGSGWRDRYESENSELSFGTHFDRVYKQRWSALSDYATGPLSGFGGVTWWTPASTVDSGTVLEAAHENGMPDDWVASQSVLLRCDTTLISKNAFVPSTLDAFFSEIFLAARESDKPTHGYAIQLKSTGPLSRGVVEVVCGDLPASAIEFSPIEIAPTERTLILNDRLRWRLAAYLREAIA